MERDQQLAGLTAALIEGLDRVAADVDPDWIVAEGDTTTVFASALTAFYRRVRFGHVEAGLRTGSLKTPFPEEMNRVVADRLASACFAPTRRAQQTLLDEGHAPADVHLTGNTVIDTLLDVAARPFDWSRSELASIARNRRIVLVTAHRRESFGEPFGRLCTALRTLAEAFNGDVDFVYPVHPNPHVREPAELYLGDVAGITLVPPLDYLSLVQLMKRSSLILTDSGGIQEEAPSLRVPVLVLRDLTERPEAVEAGFARLVGTDPDSIVSAASQLLTDEHARTEMTRGESPFGDGRAASRIVSVLLGEAR